MPLRKPAFYFFQIKDMSTMLERNRKTVFSLSICICWEDRVAPFNKLREDGIFLKHTYNCDSSEGGCLN